MKLNKIFLIESAEILNFDIFFFKMKVIKGLTLVKITHEYNHSSFARYPDLGGNFGYSCSIKNKGGFSQNLSVS